MRDQMLKFHGLIVFLCLGVVITLPQAVQAQMVAADTPVMVTADDMDYDKHTGIVTAEGNVEIVQGQRILIADELIYEQQSDRVIAKGNVSLLEPSGDVFFADVMELQDQFRKGLIEHFRARFKDNSILVAHQAKRITDDKTELQQAVYTPCPLCDANEEGDPVWQIKANKVVLDEQKQRVSYNHARFEIYGVPVFYSPYLSHAAPDADRKSGFLAPTYSSTSTLGDAIEIPYYFNIAPNMDATFKPIFTSEQGVVLSGDYRHLLRRGYYEFSGSITQPSKLDSRGKMIPGNETRGHINASGHFQLTQDWSFGFRGNRSSDATYLRRYRFGNEVDHLDSNLYLHNQSGRNSIHVEALAFQGLAADDVSERTPFILPSVKAHFETTPTQGRGDKFSLDADALVLSRQEGAKSRRLSLTGGWSIPYISSSGHMFSLNTSLRGDVYSVRDVTLSSGEELDGDKIVTRALPQVQLSWHFPLVKHYEKSSLYLEPIADFIVSPHGNNPEEIPNEDSQNIEFSYENLFSTNRFTGLDLVEAGPRVNYGVRGAYYPRTDTRINFMVGQNYRVKEESRFGQRSGLEDNFSDIVGKIDLNIVERMRMSYLFRFDEASFDPRRNEVSLGFNVKPIHFDLNYVELNGDLLDSSDSSVTNDRQEIFASASVNINKDWTFFTHGRRDLALGKWISSEARLYYHYECFDFSTTLRRDFTQFLDIIPATSLIFQVSLKNLITTPLEYEKEL